MENLEQKEAKWQAMLAKSYREYLITVACCCVGWFIFNWGTYADIGNGDMGLEFLGYLIMGAPVFLRMMLSRSISALFFWREYEVVTTYSDGSKKSDGGAESAQMQLMWWLVMLGVCLLLGGIITALKVFWLTAKTITCYLAVKQKPGFLRSPFLILIAGLLSLVLFAWIPQQVGKSRFNRPVGTVVSVDPYEATVGVAPSYVYETAKGSGTPLGTLQSGDLVIVIGEPVENNFGHKLTPIDYNGKTGWVGSERLKAKQK